MQFQDHPRATASSQLSAHRHYARRRFLAAPRGARRFGVLLESLKGFIAEEHIGEAEGNVRWKGDTWMCFLWKRHSLVGPQVALLYITDQDNHVVYTFIMQLTTIHDVHTTHKWYQWRARSLYAI